MCYERRHERVVRALREQRRESASKRDRDSYQERECERERRQQRLRLSGMALGDVDNADLSKAQQQQLQRPTVYLAPGSPSQCVCVASWKSALAHEWNSKGFRAVVSRAIGQAGRRALGQDSARIHSARLGLRSARLLLLLLLPLSAAALLLLLLLLRSGSCRPLELPGSTVGYEFWTCSHVPHGARSSNQPAIKSSKHHNLPQTTTTATTEDNNIKTINSSSASQTEIANKIKYFD